MDETRLVRALSRQRLSDGGLGVVVVLEGAELLVVMSRGVVYAVANMCTHRTLWLNHARVRPDTDELECPWHLGRFDLRTGLATLEPCVTTLKTYEVEIRGDEVFVAMPVTAKAR